MILLILLILKCAPCRYKEDEDRELVETGQLAATAQGAEEGTDNYELRGLFWMTPAPLNHLCLVQCYR